jgi:hypothetical protein
MAGEIRRGQSFPAGWWYQMFREYSFLHYENRNFDRPALYEHYHALTGESLSGEADYLHSYWIDLLMRHVAGIVPMEDSIAIEPSVADDIHFSIKRLHVCGHEVSLTKDGEKMGLSLDGGAARLVTPGTHISIDR